MAEETGDAPGLLSRAKEQETDCDWAGAAETYAKALDVVPANDSIRVGRLLEGQGHAYYQDAMQSESRVRFESQIQRAIECYLKAKAEYEKSSGPSTRPFGARSDAMLSFLRYWQTSSASEKRRFIREAWRHAIEAAKGFEEAGDRLEYLKTCSDLALSGALGYNMAEDFAAASSIVKSGLELGEKASAMLSALEEPEGTAKAFACSCAFLSALAGDAGESPEIQVWHKKAITNWEKAVQSSHRSALSGLKLVLLLGDVPPLLSRAQALDLLQRALERGRATRDRLLTGLVLDNLAGRANWDTLTASDAEVSAELRQRSLQLASESQAEFSRISLLPPGSAFEMWVAAPEASVFGVSAYHEFDLKKKREFAEKAVAAYPRALKLAEDSEYPSLPSHIQHRYSYSLTALAKTETDRLAKRKLLEKAIQLRKESMAGTQVFEPHSDWSRGTDLGLLAEAEFELAGVLDEREERARTVRQAISRNEESLELHLRVIAAVSPGAQDDLLWRYPIVGHWLFQHSGWNEVLFQLDGDKGCLVSGRDAMIRAAEMFTLSGVPSRTAECQWKAAQLCDRLQHYDEGAERFLLAADAFGAAASKTPQLGAMFDEYSHYMRAWASIEKAKSSHLKDDPESASLLYKEAAQSHKATKGWDYLSDFYLGLAAAEHGEDQSRKELYAAAKDSFDLAADSFLAAKAGIQARLGDVQSLEERKMAADLAIEADERCVYSRARSVLEEARQLEAEGNFMASSNRYSQAASSFQALLGKTDSAMDKQPLKLVLSLTEAWQAMARAESETSPEMYGKAAEHFDRARDFAVSERMKVMATGNSHFCKALEAGVAFADTTDPALHLVATKHLESAAKYYLRADLQNAAEYAKASKLLFDGYAYMDKASADENQATKAKLYTMAEKVLHLSAAAYAKAGQLAKRDQVTKLLRKVVEDRELAAALTDVFLAPDAASTTMAFASPTPIQGAAAGLDRFEHADVRATLVAKPKELHVGQDLSLEFELVNAGRGPAQLTRIEEAIPEGFAVIQEPERYRVDDRRIDLRGKKLEALRTEDVKLVLRPNAKGTLRLKPRIIYLDEAGVRRSCEPSPVEVAVKEMGISGWLRGN